MCFHPASPLFTRAKPILHRLRCLCGALWRRVILWYCVGINIKSHYVCEGGEDRGGWGERVHLYFWGFQSWALKWGGKRREMISGPWNLYYRCWQWGGWCTTNNHSLVYFPCEHTAQSSETNPAEVKGSKWDLSYTNQPDESASSHTHTNKHRSTVSISPSRACSRFINLSFITNRSVKVIVA